MKRILFIFIIISITLNSTANISLPWDSLFYAHGLTKTMSKIPTYISPELNIHHNDGCCAGLWGLTPPIAQRYGLTINEYIDERYDLKLSSKAAAQYLNDLMSIYGNENIAILTYLNGAALMVEIAKIYQIDLHNVTDADLNLLYQHLPKTNINDTSKLYKTNHLDSVYNHTGYIKYKFKHPIRISTLQDSLFFNPNNFYTQNSSTLPTTRWTNEAFIAKTTKNIDEWLSTIYDSEYEAFQAEQEIFIKQKESENNARIAAIKKANAVKIYHVKSGDTLSHIAKRHKVSVRQLKQWNNLKSDFLRIGQKIKIHTN